MEQLIQQLKKSSGVRCVLFFTLAIAVFYIPSASARDSITAETHGEIFYPDYPKPKYGKGEEREQIEHGEYLAKIGDCISCHTDTTKKGEPYAGGLPIETPFGLFFSTNITPDTKTGIGNWTDKDFIRAMKWGKKS